MSDVVTGHDWRHVERVRNTARTLALAEQADMTVVDLAALLHDMDDHKFSGDVRGPELTSRAWLLSIGVSETLSERVVEALTGASFALGRTEGSLSVEARCVRDADRLDAIGAIGIARAFAYGGYIGQPLVDSPDRPSTVRHFFEKLLRLSSTMTTTLGAVMAAERHERLLAFLGDLSAETSDPVLRALLDSLSSNHVPGGQSVPGLG